VVRTSRPAAAGLRLDAQLPCSSLGSRAGHQVCTDRAPDGCPARRRIHPDRRLACAPASSEGPYLAGWRRMRTSPGRTGGDRTASAARSPRCSARTRPSAGGHDVAHNVAGGGIWGCGSACTERGRRVPSPPAPGTCPRLIAASASRSSSPARWEPRASSWPVSPGPWSARTGRRATERDGASRGRQRGSASTAASCVGSSRHAASSSAAPRRRLAERRSPLRDVDRVVRVVERAGLARRVARLVRSAS
jgi:hypothetical protein